MVTPRHLFNFSLSPLRSQPVLMYRSPLAEDTKQWYRAAYYIPFICLFQFGWATVQISHMSLIPELTQNEEDCIKFNGVRYAFYVSNTKLS